METVTKRLYEGLFLLDSGEAASDWDGVIGAIEKVLTKNGGEIVTLNKWDERKLAYDVQRKSRGTYILVYFNCDPQGISPMEREIVLSEKIMRAMILRTDQMDTADIEKTTPAAMAEKAAAETAEKAAAAAAEKEAAAAEKEANEAAEKEAVQETVAEDQVPAEQPETEEPAGEADEQESQEEPAEPTED